MRIHSSDARRGHVLPLVALLMVVMMGMVAFGVDVGYMTTTRQQLQNAADAAALAGANRLLELEYQSTFLTAENDKAVLREKASSEARAEARKFAALNRAGGTKLSLNDSDIEVGYVAPGKSTFQSPAPTGKFPNSVRVMVRRDETVPEGQLQLFFAPLLGVRKVSLRGTATASVAVEAIEGFRTLKPGEMSLLLPIALDANVWQDFLAGKPVPNGYTKSDRYTVTPTDTPNTYDISRGGDGVPELGGVYPEKNAPGNFGLVCIGPDANNAPTFWDWIINGPSAADLQYLIQNRNGQPGSSTWVATSSKPAVLKAGPGLKASDEKYLQEILNTPRILPLFSKVEGNGQNATYTIIGFAPVTLLEARLTGNNKGITFQPVIIVDPTATPSESSSSNTATRFIYRPASLTR